MSPNCRNICVFILLALQQCQALRYSGKNGKQREVSDRSSTTPSCHSCTKDPIDWADCIACYTGPGVAFNGLKRSTHPTRIESSKKGLFDDNRDLVKRGFLDTDPDWAKRSHFPGFFEKDRGLVKPLFFDVDPDWAKRSFVDTDRDWSKLSGGGSALATTKEEKRSRFLDCKCCRITRKATCCQACNYVPDLGGTTLQKRVYAPGPNSFHGHHCACCQRGSFDYGCCLSCHLK